MKELSVKLHVYVEVEDEEDAKMKIRILEERLLYEERFDYTLYEAFIEENGKKARIEI